MVRTAEAKIAGIVPARDGPLAQSGTGAGPGPGRERGGQA